MAKITTLDVWKNLMDEKDLIYFDEFRHTSSLDLEQMREDWKAIRRYALSKLNQDLNDRGLFGQLLNIDVSDDELYPYLEYNIIKALFFKYSRILDFSNGFIPKNLIIIKKHTDI